MRIKKNFAIETTRKILNTNDNKNECAEYINDQFYSRYGGFWYYNGFYINYCHGT